MVVAPSQVKNSSFNKCNGGVVETSRYLLRCGIWLCEDPSDAVHVSSYGIQTWAHVQRFFWPRAKVFFCQGFSLQHNLRATAGKSELRTLLQGVVPSASNFFFSTEAHSLTAISNHQSCHLFGNSSFRSDHSLLGLGLSSRSRSTICKLSSICSSQLSLLLPAACC